MLHRDDCSALVDEAFTEETRQLGRGVLVIVGVVALTLVGEQGMQHVVAVVVPLRSEAGGQQAGAVVLVFQYQVHVAARLDAGVHALGQLGEETAVGNRMHGVEAQPVEAVVQQPHQGVVDEEVAHFAAAEIDAVAPGRLLVVAEEVLGIAAQVVAVRPEVVVDHVEKDHQAQPVGGVDQVLEFFRASVGGFRRIGRTPS